MSGNNVWKPFKKFEYQNLLPAELRSKVRFLYGEAYRGRKER